MLLFGHSVIWRQFGQLKVSPPCCRSRVSRHDLQKVWRHFSIFGSLVSLNCSWQTEHFNSLLTSSKRVLLSAMTWKTQPLNSSVVCEKKLNTRDREAADRALNPTSRTRPQQKLLKDGVARKLRDSVSLMIFYYLCKNCLFPQFTSFVKILWIAMNSWKSNNFRFLFLRNAYPRPRGVMAWLSTTLYAKKCKRGMYM